MGPSDPILACSGLKISHFLCFFHHSVFTLIIKFSPLSRLKFISHNRKLDQELDQLTFMTELQHAKVV